MHFTGTKTFSIQIRDINLLTKNENKPWEKIRVNIGFWPEVEPNTLTETPFKKWK